MTSLTNRAAAVASSAAIEAARASLALVRELAWSCIVASAVRLPLAVAVCTLLCLAMVAPSAWLVLRQPEASAIGQSLLALVVALSAGVGIVWGVHWTLHRGALAALAVLERRIPDAVDTLFGPLVNVAGEQLPSLPIADVRDYFAKAAEQAFHLPGAGRWRWLQWLSARVARWFLRAELTIVEQVLSRLQARGEKHVSLASLKGCVQDELVTRAGGAARGQLFQFDLAVAAVVFLLLVMPNVLLVWLLG